MRSLKREFAASCAVNRFQAQDFTRLIFDNHLEWTAADVAINREPLRRYARIKNRLEALAVPIWS